MRVSRKEQKIVHEQLVGTQPVAEVKSADVVSVASITGNLIASGRFENVDMAIDTAIEIVSKINHRMKGNV